MKNEPNENMSWHQGKEVWKKYLNIWIQICSKVCFKNKQKKENGWNICVPEAETLCLNLFSIIKCLINYRFESSMICYIYTIYLKVYCAQKAIEENT